jgi:hypothetical protein
MVLNRLHLRRHCCFVKSRQHSPKKRDRARPISAFKRETWRAGVLGALQGHRADGQSKRNDSALKPVAFRYKQKIDPKGLSQFGLIVEAVEKVNSDLVVRDKEGKPYSVRYEAVNAMLLNEFLKEHRKVEGLEANATEQQKEIKALATMVK